MGRMSDLDIERQELGDDSKAIPKSILAIMLGCTCKHKGVVDAKCRIHFNPIKEPA